MARAISGQYSASSGSTSEKAVSASDVAGNVLRVKNLSSNTMYVGNDGSGAVDGTTGFELGGGEQTDILLDSEVEGGDNDLYIYAGAGGDTLAYAVIG